MNLIDWAGLVLSPWMQTSYNPDIIHSNSVNPQFVTHGHGLSHRRAAAAPRPPVRRAPAPLRPPYPPPPRPPSASPRCRYALRPPPSASLKICSVPTSEHRPCQHRERRRLADGIWVLACSCRSAAAESPPCSCVLMACLSFRRRSTFPSLLQGVSPPSFSLHLSVC